MTMAAQPTADASGHALAVVSAMSATTQLADWKDPQLTEKPATPCEKESSGDLEHLLRNHFHEYESTEEMSHRKDVLGHLSALVEDWVRLVYQKKDLLDTYSPSLGAQIFTFGSFRLDVNSPGADIDTLVLCSEQITRQDFFENFYAMLEQHPHVKRLTSAPGAYVPVMNIVFYDIPFDLIFSKLQQPTIPPMLNLSDNRILDLIFEDQNVRSVNGRRVTDMILGLVPDHHTFRVSLRCIKIWAKARHVYGNSMGFLGGVSWALLVARICQWHPLATPEEVIAHFFKTYGEYHWDVTHPVELTPTLEGGRYAHMVWTANRHHMMSRKTSMYVITPAYPSQNSTNNVGPSTLYVMRQEFLRAAEIADRVLSGSATWMDFFASCDFFANYKMYIQLTCMTRTRKAFDGWLAFVESRVRILVNIVERNSQLIAHPCVTKFPVPDEARTDPENWPYQSSYFIGLDTFNPPTHPADAPTFDLNAAVVDFNLQVAERRPNPEVPLTDIEIVIAPVPQPSLPAWLFMEGRVPHYNPPHSRSRTAPAKTRKRGPRAENQDRAMTTAAATQTPERPPEKQRTTMVVATAVPDASSAAASDDALWKRNLQIGLEEISEPGLDFDPFTLLPVVRLQAADQILGVVDAEDVRQSSADQDWCTQHEMD